MNKLTSIAIAAAVAIALPSASLAQVDVEAGGEVGVGVDAGGSGAGTEVDAGTDVNAGTDTSAGASMSAGAGVDLTAEAAADKISGSGATVAQIEAVTDPAMIKIVTVAELTADASTDATRLHQAITGNAATMTELRTSLSANAAISTKLEQEGYTVEDVVAVTAEADGSLTLFVEGEANM